ncbi:MAG: nuclear transport factor 2 family protein [Candidatus Poriferisodalaceae bacterium]|nr:MAG: hypothetical protein CNE88_07485 [Acidimicrobiales bacterium MED-G01]
MTYSHSELSDRQEIVDLLSAYCRAIDDNRPDGVVSLFSEDCYLDYGGQLPIVQGHAAARKFFAIGTGRLYAKSAHFVSNIEVSFPDKDQAVASSYVNAWHEFQNHQPDAWIFGRYDDELSRSDTGWLIHKRTFRSMGDHNWVGEMSYIDRTGPDQ